MNQIIKSFLGVFLILFMCASSIAIFTMFLTVLQAQNAQAEIVRELEDSNYYPSVTKACFARAEEAGYDLKIAVIRHGAEAEEWLCAADVPAQAEECDCVRVSLEFPIRIALFQIGEVHSLQAYAY